MKFASDRGKKESVELFAANLDALRKFVQASSL